MKVLAAVTAIAFVFGLVRAPAAIGRGIAYERVGRLEQAKRFDEAVKQLEPILEKYPTAEEVRIDLIRDYIGADRLEDAAKTLDWFSGRQITNEQKDTLDGLEKALIDRAKAENPDGFSEAGKA
ncbi:hypothetical protein OP10G_0835 [Fimbriimonas ginsengisoli Gsoil 348]|uniref:Tetratricopeptide repeat protein n=1 Tax=Fimbriimonas ginsengisoli Gsoil 348 TaxID=661478 RepID=A0A068NKT6_FIMGI|nr:hypothetical protein OP10G_0835 [Fimbriimonas ginsengisoli Gsoil 348]